MSTSDLTQRGRFEIVHLTGGPYDSTVVPIEYGQITIPVSDLNPLPQGNAKIPPGTYERIGRELRDECWVSVFEFTARA